MAILKILKRDAKEWQIMSKKVEATEYGNVVVRVGKLMHTYLLST